MLVLEKISDYEIYSYEYKARHTPRRPHLPLATRGPLRAECGGVHYSNEHAVLITLTHKLTHYNLNDNYNQIFKLNTHASFSWNAVS